MLLSSKDIAKQFAGQTVRCKLTKSAPAIDANGNPVSEFDAKIVGWKFAVLKEPSFVCVEVLPPVKTKLLLFNMNDDYNYTVKRNPKGFGKKLLPEEIILPEVPKSVVPQAILTKPARIIPEWPDKCRDCGSPAVVMSTRIDCSNPLCKNKFRTHSGLDLFLPKEMRPPGWEKDPNRKRRAGVDGEDFIVCALCKARAIDGSFAKDKIGTFKAKCPKDHSWTFELNIGDKLAGKTTMVYKGKNIFIPYKI